MQIKLRYILCLFVLLSGGGRISAQFQMEWAYSHYFGVGNIVQCVPDNIGGIFVGDQVLDTTCNYDLGQITHLNTIGSIAWANDLYYEMPCRTQRLQSLIGANDRLYYSVQDTSGTVVKGDSSSNEIWKVDTGLTFRVNTIDNTGHATCFVPQWSEVICLDSTGSVAWSYSLPYSFSTSIWEIVNDKEGNRIVGFEYTDPSQMDAQGVGVIKLDSLGQFLWDTLISHSVSTDEDLYVDIKLDQLDNIYIVARDATLFGSFVTKIDPSGNVIASAAFTPTPLFLPTQLEVDTIHGLVYIAGRTVDSLIVLKYDAQLNPLDTVYFDRLFPDLHVIAINDYGYLFHLWVSDSNSVFNLRLEMFDHGGQLTDVYTYFDTTLYYALYPKGIFFDPLGSIFVACNGRDTNLDDIGLVIKLTNPLGITVPTTADNSFHVYPNPASSLVNITIDGEHGQSEMTLINSSGQVVSSSSFNGNSFSFNTEELSSGMYFIEIITDNGNCSTQKLIIDHP